MGPPWEADFVAGVPVVAQNDARYHDQVPYECQYPQAVPTREDFGHLSVHPSYTVTSNLYPESRNPSSTSVSYGMMMPPGSGMIHTAQQQRSSTMPQDHQPAGKAESKSQRTLPLATRGGRHPSLPMQSEAFRAFEAGSNNLGAEPESHGRSRHNPKKGRNASRGFPRHPRGNFRQ